MTCCVRCLRHSRLVGEKRTAYFLSATIFPSSEHSRDSLENAQREMTADKGLHYCGHALLCCQQGIGYYGRWACY